MRTIYHLFKSDTPEFEIFREKLVGLLKPYSPTTEAGSRIISLALREWSNGALVPASVLDIYGKISYWSAVIPVDLKLARLHTPHAPESYSLIGFSYNDYEYKPNMEAFSFKKTVAPNYRFNIQPSELDNRFADKINNIIKAITSEIGSYSNTKIIPHIFNKDLDEVYCTPVPARYIKDTHVISNKPAWLPNDRLSYRFWPAGFKLKELLSFLVESPVHPRTFRQYVVNIKAYARANKLKLTDSSWRQILKPIINKQISLSDIPYTELLNVVNGIEKYPLVVQQYWLDNVIPKTGFQHVRSLEYLMRHPTYTSFGNEALDLSKKQMSAILKIGYNDCNTYNMHGGYAPAMYMLAICHKIKNKKFKSENLRDLAKILNLRFKNNEARRQNTMLIKYIQEYGFWSEFYTHAKRELNNTIDLLAWLSGHDLKSYLAAPEAYTDTNLAECLNIKDTYSGSNIKEYKWIHNHAIAAWHAVPLEFKTQFLRQVGKHYQRFDEHAIRTGDITQENCIISTYAKDFNKNVWDTLKDLHMPNTVDALIATIDTCSIKTETPMTIPFEL